MITLIEALRYRSLRDVRQDLGTFHVLVGPNASGKSTFLDVPGFLGDLLRRGLTDAIGERSPTLQNLLWMRENARLELAVELEIPKPQRKRLAPGYRSARYEMAVGYARKGVFAILGETLWLKPATQPAGRVRGNLFPAESEPRPSLMQSAHTDHPPDWRRVVSKDSASGNDHFFAETSDWSNPFRLGPSRPALANLPEDEERFPVATWAKRTLMEGLRRLALDSTAMRRPAPPGSTPEFQPDGSNLPWVLEDLRQHDRRRFDEWLAHVRTAVPDIQAVTTVERKDDKHRYLRITYANGLRTPSWTVSDGTLRLLALTLLAYQDMPARTYLIEEPENGIHPQAVECVFQALSSARDRQILCASHSPVLLSLTEPASILCFARAANGESDVVRGTEHPLLAHWRRETDLGTLFASGVLG